MSEAITKTINIRQPVRAIIVPVLIGSGIKGDPYREVSHIFYEDTLEFVGQIDNWEEKSNE